jgi:putative ATPase
MQQLGYGREYRYAHDEPDAYAAGEQYLPEGMRGQKFYEPTPRGLEGRIRERLDELNKLDRAARENGEKLAPPPTPPQPRGGPEAGPLEAGN